MKKIVSLLMIAAMLAILAVSVSAAPTFDTAKPAPGEELFSVGPNSSEMSEFSGKFSNLQETGGGSFCNKADSSARYDFEVDVDGIYTFVVEYIARPDKTRFIDYQIDDGDSILVDLEESADKRWLSVTAELDAGEHSFYLKAPTGFDDNIIKSCDIYGWSLFLTEEIVETVEEAPAAAETAPATSDTAFVALIMIALSTAAVTAAAKKQR